MIFFLLNSLSKFKKCHKNQNVEETSQNIKKSEMKILNFTQVEYNNKLFDKKTSYISRLQCKETDINIIISYMKSEPEKKVSL